MKVLKHFLPFIILGVVEGLSYLYLKPSNYEVFFMGWSLFFLFLLIYNVFNVKSDDIKSVGGLHSGAGNPGLNLKLAEEASKNKLSNIKFGGGLLDPSNIQFVFLLVINIICYIRVMPQ